MDQVSRKRPGQASTAGTITPCPPWCRYPWQEETLSYHTSARIDLPEGFSVHLERCDDPHGDDGSSGTRGLLRRRGDASGDPDEIPASMLPVSIPALEALRDHLSALEG
jgi:hypothetical protein